MKYYCETKRATDLTRNTLAIILAGGEGSRLKDLTKWRAKPAVPFCRLQDTIGDKLLPTFCKLCKNRRAHSWLI
jgi:molybdopterin-guanine dinucleotide biosynthesis protein A